MLMIQHCYVSIAGINNILNLYPRSRSYLALTPTGYWARMNKVSGIRSGMWTAGGLGSSMADWHSSTIGRDKVGSC